MFFLRVALVSGLMLVSANAVLAQSPKEKTAAAVRQADQNAYQATMKCFVVNGNAKAERDRAGDRAKAASYEAAARRSFDLAVQLGQKLGYSKSRIEQDLDRIEETELSRLVADVAYNRDAAITCRALGLLG